MANGIEPYIGHKPGDPITAEDWNSMQVDIKKDIADQVQKGVGGIKSVASAGDADKLGGKTPEQLTQEIIDKALEAIPGRTGYMQTFNRLKIGVPKDLAHKLKVFPLVDIYQLDYFPVVCARGESKEDQQLAWVNFYLYHSINERRIHYGKGPKDYVDIEAQDKTPFKILFRDMLQLFKVEYTDDTNLDDLETDFWKSLFTSPNNDPFDADQYCHSPWFEKCCGLKRKVGDLKRGGDWDDIWFKMMPRKTINYNLPDPTVAPTQIQVAHYDFNTLGITLLSKPTLPAGTGQPEDELKVMVLMKV